MHPRGRAATVSLITLILLGAFLAGCGGGGSQDSAEKKQGDEAAKKDAPQKDAQQKDAQQKDAPQMKIAIGKVRTVIPDKRRLVLRQAEEMQGGERLAFNVRKTAKIEQGGEKVEMGDISEGQQAQVQYIVKNDVNRALSVHLFEVEDQQPSGEGEKTG